MERLLRPYRSRRTDVGAVQLKQPSALSRFWLWASGRLEHGSEGDTTAVQAAALPWRLSIHHEIEIMLVTSRTSGRWIPPKGWPMRGKTLAEAAAIEAFEEAGVEGTVSHEAIGEFSRMKTRPLSGRIECLVMVHPLKVTRDLDEWPERSQRRRRWFKWEDAAAAVDSPELAALIRRFGAAGSVETRP